MACTVNKKTKLSSTHTPSGKRIKSTVLAALNNELDLLNNLSSASESNAGVDKDEISSQDGNDEATDNKAPQSDLDDEPMNILTPLATVMKKCKRRSNKCESLHVTD
jgi:hypothetical protein